MRLENIGLTVSAIGCVLGVLLITVGVLLYLNHNQNKVMIATAARTLGIGSLTIMVSIPLSIPNYLLASSTTDGISLLGVIIMAVFLGSPLIMMGLASYIGLNAKANEILNSATAQDKIRYIL